jgi:DNA-binding GntR family transcriptional regulator
MPAMSLNLRDSPSPLAPDQGAGVSLRELAYRQLSDLLASGALAPGEKISLRAAAEALGMSMMPVREAVSRLVADRALEVTPNRAVRVPVMTKAQFLDLTWTRAMIEGTAAGEAAVRRTRAELDDISTAEALMRAQSLSSRPDVGRAIALNKDFHFAIYAAAHSTALLNVIRGLWLKAGPVITLNVREKPARLSSNTISIHSEILRAIEKGDRDAAHAATAADIESAANYIITEVGLPD